MTSPGLGLALYLSTITRLRARKAEILLQQTIPFSRADACISIAVKATMCGCSSYKTHSQGQMSWGLWEIACLQISLFLMLFSCCKMLS